MLSFIGLVLFYLLAPLLINYLSYRYKVIRKIGPVVIAYTFGLLLGNSGILPQASSAMVELISNKHILLTNKYIQELFSQGVITGEDVRYFKFYHIQDLLTTLAVAFALPMLLYSLNVRLWFKVAGKTFFSLFLGLVSVIIPIVLGYFLFKNQISDSWQVAGMLTGVYSGGTPNLAALQKALDVDNLTYILTNTYDLMIGALFLLFVMTVGQKVLLKVLPAYKSTGTRTEQTEFELEKELKLPFFEPVKKKYLLPNFAAIAVSLLIVVISYGLSQLFREDLQMMVVILSITTLAIGASMIPKINHIKKTFDYGMYLILIFSVVVASMADLRNFSMASIDLLFWVLIVYVFSLAIHVALSAIFKIDADNVIIVSTALTCSPPFVPVVAGALKNKEIIISGLTVGIIGYAIGNYLGILMAQTLSFF